MRPNKYYSLEQDGTKVDIEIYGDITSWPWLVSDVSSYNLVQQIKGLTDVDEITVGINSYGGEVGEGLAIYNALKNSPAKVTTRCDGFACSAASVVFAAGDVRLMNDASLLMIHNAWTYAEGDANALRKQAEDLDKITSGSIKAYKAIVSIEEDELKQLMDTESWITPDEAVEMGFATGIIKSEKTDKASQSVRKKVFQMIMNPYKQLVDDEDPDDTGDATTGGTNEDPEPDDATADDGGDATGDGTDDATDDGAADDGTGGEDNPDDDPDDDQEGQMQQLMQAIINM